MHEIDLTTSPYQRFLGLELIEADEGAVTLRLPFRKEFLRQDGSEWIHGGVISALADIAADYAIVTRTGAGVPTIDLRIDWLRPAPAGALIAHAKTLKVGRTISVAEVEIEDESGRIVALGRGAYASPRKSGSAFQSEHEEGSEKAPEPPVQEPSSALPPPDQLNQIGVLKRREIEARIIAPFVEALCTALERDKVLEILRQVIVEIARRQGEDLAGSMGGCSASHLAASLGDWKKDDALELRVLEESEERLSFNVTRCRYAELYRSLGIPELGAILSCGRDAALIEGFNPELELERSQTILGGASHCDFRYRKKQ